MVIPAPVLDCEACCLAAYEAVARLDGVRQAIATFKNGGKVLTLIAPAKVDRSKREEALRKAGVSRSQEVSAAAARTPSPAGAL